MKFIRLFILSVALLIGTAAHAEKPERIIIFNGYYFNELPAVIKSHSTPHDMKMFFIETPNATKAIGMCSPSVELSEDALRYSIPVENVPEGEELLRRYNEKKNENSINFTLSATKPLINVGDKFPKFSATDINGKTWTNADIEGKVMALNLWFTGCGPCRKEMPELSTWKDEMPDVMFFSSTYEAPEIARQVLDKVNFNWIPLVNDTQFKEWIGRNGYPLTIIVDKSGKIAAFEYGTSPEQRDALKNKILQLR
ncbi:MAG: TlpA family protein disulfide reductase [Muribaculaceae bacterium]|nr:TlpA family protein disulfide reductase [Muribaculaceae bacterium]